MEYIYIRREDDNIILKEAASRFETLDNESLILEYNKQEKCGITGVHAQALCLMAMANIFLRRFRVSPIYMENNVLGMHGKIKLSGDSFEYVE